MSAPEPTFNVYDTSAVSELLSPSADGSAEWIVEALRRKPGAITTLTLADVLVSVPLDQIDSLREALNEAFDVIEVTEQDAYSGAYWHRYPGKTGPFSNYTLNTDVNQAVARRLGAGFVSSE